MIVANAQLLMELKTSDSLTGAAGRQFLPGVARFGWVGLVVVPSKPAPVAFRYSDRRNQARRSSQLVGHFDLPVFPIAQVSVRVASYAVEKVRREDDSEEAGVATSFV